MTKGKFGLPLAITAVIAFVLAVLNQPIALLLVVGFAFLAEKNEWLNRQAAQALVLNLVYNLFALIFNIIFGYFTTLFDWLEEYDIVNLIHDIHTVTDDVLIVVLIVFSVIAIVKVLCGREANLPLIALIAGAAVRKVPNVPGQNAARRCPNCGNAIASDGIHFCPHCSQKLD